MKLTFRRVASTVAAAAALTVGGTLTSAVTGTALTSANAASMSRNADLSININLWHDTEMVPAALNPGGALKVCDEMILPAIGVYNSDVAYVNTYICENMVVTCARQAYYAAKNAGMTLKSVDEYGNFDFYCRLML
jgi:hypothetical protein